MPLVTLSVSLSDKTKAFNHTHFRTVSTPFDELAPRITTHVWSPVVWKEGVRLKANFQTSDLIVMDFDSGKWSTEDAHAWASEFALDAIIAPTKSHMKPKQIGSMTVCLPRFRLIIRADKPCTSLADYEHTLQTLTDALPADKSCKDGARFYFPSMSVDTKDNSCVTPMSWLSCPPEETEAARAMRRRAEIPKEHMRNKTLLPQHIIRWLKVGADVGERHKTAYMLGLELGLRGFTEDETISMAKTFGSNLPTIGEQELRRAISNGHRKAQESAR